MVGVEVIARLLGGIVLLLSNAVFVGTEFALTRVRQFDRDQFEGNWGLERAWEMTERLEIYLSGCQVGITISSVGLGVVAEPAVTAVVQPLFVLVGLASPGAHAAVSVLAALAVVNILHVIVGEQVPTYFGVERTRTAAMFGGPVLYWWTNLMWPVIVGADWIAKAVLGLAGVEISRSWTEAESEEGPRGTLRRQMGEVLSRGDLDDERRQEIINALEIGETPVASVMVDREDVVALSTADDAATNLERMRTHPHVRFPLVGDDLETFHGVVYAPEVLRHVDALESGEVTFEGLARDPLVLSSYATVSDAIDGFQSASEELALVVPETDVEPVTGDGPRELTRVVGILTPTDAWEAITGQLEDPLDSETGPP